MQNNISSISIDRNALEPDNTLSLDKINSSKMKSSSIHSFQNNVSSSELKDIKQHDSMANVLKRLDYSELAELTLNEGDIKKLCNKLDYSKPLIKSNTGYLKHLNNEGKYEKMDQHLRVYGERDEGYYKDKKGTIAYNVLTANNSPFVLKHCSQGVQEQMVDKALECLQYCSKGHCCKG